MELKWLGPYYLDSEPQPPEGNMMQQLIEERFNVKIEIANISSADNEKLPLWFAEGNTADYVSVKLAFGQSLVDQGPAAVLSQGVALGACARVGGPDGGHVRRPPGTGDDLQGRGMGAPLQQLGGGRIVLPAAGPQGLDGQPEHHRRPGHDRGALRAAEAVHLWRSGRRRQGRHLRDEPHLVRVRARLLPGCSPPTGTRTSRST